MDESTCYNTAINEGGVAVQGVSNFFSNASGRRWLVIGVVVVIALVGLFSGVRRVDTGKIGVVAVWSSDGT